MADLVEKIWEKLSHWAGLAVVGLMFGLMAFSANIEIKDLDLWLHIKMGKIIWESGFVPAVDVLSCTIAGRPWINHEWLFQIIAYALFEFGGADGLITMQVMVVVMTLLILLFLGYSRDKQLGFLFLFLFVCLVYQTRFTIRPDIFSLLFFVVYIYILALHLDKRWSVYALFVVQVLWANFHGFFFWGPVLVLIALLAEVIKRRVKLPCEWNDAGRLSDEEFTRLKWAFPVVILATLVNPLTFKGAWYPVDVFFNIAGDSRIFFKYIQELRPPIDWGNPFSSDYMYYKQLIVISVLGFFFNRRKIDIGDLFVWAIFLLFSMVAVRNVVYFAFAAYFICLSNFNGITLGSLAPLSFKGKKFQYITSFLVKVFLLVWIIQYGTDLSNRAYFDFDKYEMKSEFGGITLRNYPTKAVDFLVENKVKGNFFNDFNSGAYLVGRCAPDIKVFIDGRTEVYGPEFFQEIYQKAWKDAEPGHMSRIIKHFGLTGALLNSVHVPVPTPTLNFFYAQKDWAVVYFDYDAVIFLKDVPQNRDIIDRYKLDLSTWKAKRLDLQRLGARPIAPFQNINRAFSLDALGLSGPAFEEANAALEVNPSVLDPYKIIGKIQAERMNFGQAFINFRIAAMISPQDVESRYNLALAYEKLGDWDGAVKQYRQVVRFDPQNPRGYFLLGQALIRDKKYSEAVEVLRVAHQMAPTAVRELLDLGDGLFNLGEFTHAMAVYKIALGAKKELDQVHCKIALTYQSLGQMDLAEKEFQTSRDLKPAEGPAQKNLLQAP